MEKEPAMEGDVMKYLSQIVIIGGITLIGEMLNIFLPLPVPGSVYGLILLLIALCTKIVKEEQIRETADFLVTIMPLLFVSPSVSLITVYAGIADAVVPLVLVAIISTIVVMVVTGLTAQYIIRYKERKEEKQKDLQRETSAAEK
jgi:holin-like protein